MKEKNTLTRCTYVWFAQNQTSRPLQTSYAPLSTPPLTIHSYFSITLRSFDLAQESRGLIEQTSSCFSGRPSLVFKRHRISPPLNRVIYCDYLYLPLPISVKNVLIYFYVQIYIAHIYIAQMVDIISNLSQNEILEFKQPP